MRIKVENESLVKDTNNGAVLETDKGKLDKHRAIRKSIKDRSNKIDILVDKINKLEKQLEEINGKLNT